MKEHGFDIDKGLKDLNFVTRIKVHHKSICFHVPDRSDNEQLDCDIKHSTSLDNSGDTMMRAEYSRIYQ